MKEMFIICQVLFLFIITIEDCNADERSRTSKGEIFVFGQQMIGDTATGSGIDLEIEDAIAGGIGIGTNFNDFVNLNFDLFFTASDVIATGYGNQIKGDTNIFGMDLNLDYNVLKFPFTPLITGGIGFINFNGDIEGYPFDETDFSYNLGAGFRWDITEYVFVKGIYKSTWTELEDTDGAIMFNGINFSFGYVF